MELGDHSIVQLDVNANPVNEYHLPAQLKLLPLGIVMCPYFHYSLLITNWKKRAVVQMRCLISCSAESKNFLFTCETLLKTNKKPRCRYDSRPTVLDYLVGHKLN